MVMPRYFHVKYKNSRSINYTYFSIRILILSRLNEKMRILISCIKQCLRPSQLLDPLIMGPSIIMMTWYDVYPSTNIHIVSKVILVFWREKKLYFDYTMDKQFGGCPRVKVQISSRSPNTIVISSSAWGIRNSRRVFTTSLLLFSVVVCFCSQTPYNG